MHAFMLELPVESSHPNPRHENGKQSIKHWEKVLKNRAVCQSHNVCGHATGGY